MVEVTQSEAVKFLEHACRNWADLCFNTDDLEDVRVALQDFAARHRIAERERNAGICDEAAKFAAPTPGDHMALAIEQTAKTLAQAIRAASDD